MICEPEFVSHKLEAQDDLLILSTDGLYRSMSQGRVVDRVRSLRAAGLSLSQICGQIVDEVLQDGRHPSNDNVTLMIVDLAAYYRDASVKPTLSPLAVSTPKHLKLRENQSEAGQTESNLVYTSSKQSAQSPLSSPRRALPTILVEVNSPTSNPDYSSENSSCHAQSITNSVYAFFGDSPESHQRQS